MGTLSITEYETRKGVELDPDTARALRAYSPRLQVQPSYGEGFDLTATSWIGAIQVGNLALNIVPKLTIGRLFFLISYALDPAAWRDDLFDFAADSSLVEALAPGFQRQASRALRRGLLQGYRVREKALLTVKGGIRFGDQIRERFGRVPPVEVSYDEFTEDTDENRILRAAVERLLELPIRSQSLRRQLRGLRWALSGVESIDYATGRMPKVQFTRLNEHYRPALRIAELVLTGTSIRYEHGGVRTSCFLLDMNDVFEQFVRVGLREALGASDRSFPGSDALPTRQWLDRDRRVRLKPDLSWWAGGVPVFVGDAKYKSTGSRGENPDIYQVLAYAVAMGLDSAMLVYARGEQEPARLRIEKAGVTVNVIALDLEQAPEGLLEDLDEVAAMIKRRAASRAAAPMATRTA